MNNFDVGIRKFVENDQLKYWLLISAKAMPPEEEENVFKKLKYQNHNVIKTCFQIPETIHWKILIITTVYLNIILYVTFFWIAPSSFVEPAIVLMHLTCLFYWIDVIAAIIKLKKRKKPIRCRRIMYFVIDGISLLPLSTIYLITSKERNMATVWKMRTITLLRFYRIPQFFSTFSNSKKNNDIISIFGCALITVIFLMGFANIFIYRLDEYTTITIHEWNKTNENTVAVSVYLVSQTAFNVAYGDIKATSYPQMALSALAMYAGTSAITGLFPGILSNMYISKTKKREYYRWEYESIMNIFKNRKLDKKVLEKLRDNMLMLWKYTRGYTDPPHVQILPLSLQKEIYFDINYEFLNRSLIFQMRPRSFLRNVAMLMKYAYYLPGDVILEPFGAEETMMCVASGVIEVLSEENDETPLLSLTRGTILGETSLFISRPVPCFVRASTYVELQVLRKVDFSRLALIYPDIFRLIRQDILGRIAFTKRRREEDMDFAGVDVSFRDLERRKRTKVFLKTWKDFQKESVKETITDDRKTEILELYVLSENIPRVKTLPVDIVRSKPFILRPNNHLRKFWDIFLSLVIFFVAISYPLWTAYQRDVSPNKYMAMLTIKLIYFMDLLIECSTAIERKDHFTYETSFKQIIRHKLKTFGFYLDIIATYHLSIYNKLIWPSQSDYAYLLLSLNSLLKVWRLIYYVNKLQNDMRNNLVFTIIVKYLIIFVIMIVWSTVLLYLVACPGEFCLPERWYHQYELNHSNEEDPSHGISPLSLSLYFATVTLFAVGYGDIVPTSVLDCLAAAFCIIMGVSIFVFFAAETSSALKHMSRNKIEYQEDIFGVNKFMIDHEIPQDLQNDVRNFLKLQWEYDKGYSMRKHYKLKKVPSLQKQIWLAELTKALFPLPLFRDANPEFLKLLAKLSQLRVLPANTDILQAGSYFRVMYVLESGYCQVSGPQYFRPKVVGPVNYFGAVEMILGTPQAVTVHSLTHVRVLSLNYSSYLKAITKFPSAKVQIQKILDEYIRRNELSEFINTFENVQKDRTASSMINRFYRLRPCMNVYKYHKGTKTSYWDPFTAWGKFQILQFFILPFVVTPESLFVKIMVIVRILSALALAVVAPIQFCFPRRTKEFMIFITTQQFINALSLYLMLHVAYYDEKGVLVFHPAKTAPRYLKGCFVLDLITIFPYSFLRWLTTTEHNAPPNLYIDAPALILVLHVYKFIQGCQYLEENILRKTDKLKILKYIPLAFLLTNSISGVMILLSCDEESGTDDIQPQGNRLAREYQEALHLLCSRGPYKNQTLDDKSAFKLYITTLYWVTATIASIGFGDIVAYKERTMIAVVIIVTYGIFFFCYIYANIASNMLNTNIQITTHRTNILKMIKFMKNNNVEPDLQQRLTLHYEYLWKRTEGETPQFVFNKVYALLRERLVSSTYEDTIRQNKVFDKWEKVITRLIADNLNEIYFLRGEIIVKHNDILEHIYLIYRGKVTLLTKRGHKITSMGRGGLFGNISNKPFALSSEIVVAEENVDVLRWDCKVFFQFLKDIPGVEELVKTLMSVKEGHIMPKPKDQEDDAGSFKLNLYLLQTPVTDMTASENDEESDQKRLFLFKTIYLPKNKKFFYFIIIPETNLHNGIAICVFVVAYLSVFLTLYMFGFQDISTVLVILSYVLDAIFVLQIILELHMSHIDRYGNCVISRKKILNRYLNSKKIIYDLLSIVPLEIFALTNPGPLLLTFFRLNRVLRAFHIFDFYEIKQKNLMTNEIYLQTFWILLMVILMLHVLACVWFVAVCPLGYWQEPTWVTEMDFLEKEKWELYFYSVYHIIVIAVSAGMQELDIYSVPEIMLDVAFMFITRLSVVYLAALLSAAINSQRLSLVLFHERITELTSIFTRQNICKYQLVKMWNYVTTLWVTERGKQIPTFISTAPYVMKCEVMYEMYGKHLSQSYIFSKLDITFLRQLAFHLQRFVYFPGNYIVQQGDIDETMYFIHQGEVSVLTIHPDLMETIHFTLGEDDHFGMSQGYFKGTPHTFSYRAETNVEILSLTLSHWQHLLKYFPEDDQIIKATLESLPKKTS